MSIQDLKPDFVLLVHYEIDNNNKVLEQSKLDLKHLISTLHHNGFSTQIRELSQLEVLVFVKLLGYKYTEQAEKDLIQNYEFGVTAHPDSRAERLRIVYNFLTSKQGLDIKPKSSNWIYVKLIVPINSDKFYLDSSIIEDLNLNNPLKEFNTNYIVEHFGQSTAFYFEFLKTYTVALVPLAVVGLISYFKRGHSYSLAYSFVSGIWSVLFLTFWKRRESYLANAWGVQNSHLVDQYAGELSAINDKYEEHSTYYHSMKENQAFKRFLKQVAFVPVALSYTAILVAVQLSCFVLEIFLTEIYDGPLKSMVSLIPTIAISVFVPVFTILYNFAIEKAVNWEGLDNYYSETKSSVIKSFVLSFMTSYVPLFITSFIYLPFAHLIQPHLGNIRTYLAEALGNFSYASYLLKLKSQEEFVINQARLDKQYRYFIITNQVIQIFLKYILPVVIRLATSKTKKNYKIKDKPSESQWLNNIRKLMAFPVYNVHDDFRGVILQFGYLTLFGPVWSLAPIVCIIFNIITYKLDYMKLTGGKYFQPSVPNRIDSIYPWDNILFFLTWCGSVVGPIVTLFYRHGTKPVKVYGEGEFGLDKASTNLDSPFYFVLILFASEHIFFGLYFLFGTISSLFKTEAEWKNDFLDNDIKLRHDYYTEKVKSTIPVPDDGEWSKFDIKNVLMDASHHPDLEVAKPTESEVIGSSSQHLTGVQKNPSADLNAKRASLEAIKDPTDKVIETKDKDGKTVLSTIDDNHHFKPEPVKTPVVKSTVDVVEPKEEVDDDDEPVEEVPIRSTTRETSEPPSVSSDTSNSSSSNKAKTKIKKFFKKT